MKDETLSIQDVSDTALWVAHYRARETEKPNPLFTDPLAKLLVGDRGARIAQELKATSAQTEYNVLIRTVIIDRYLQTLVEQGVDCVLNLGAGLDTRPYRLNLPARLRWIEVDYPHMIALKNGRLSHEKPRCELRRMPMDLNDRAARRNFLRDLGSSAGKIAVLTEGVLPYLTEEQVDSLAEDLRAEASIAYWIADYISPAIYKYIKSPARARKMRNAPFQFLPTDWLGFFRSRHWEPKTIQYLPEEGLKLGRRMPVPWLARLLGPFFSSRTKEQFRRSSGYMIMERAPKRS